MTKKRVPIRNPGNRTKSISLPTAIAEAIQARAEREGRSFSNMVTQILKHQLTLGEIGGNLAMAEPNPAKPDPALEEVGLRPGLLTVEDVLGNQILSLDGSENPTKKGKIKNNRNPPEK